jgi:hypothetical protein
MMYGQLMTTTSMGLSEETNERIHAVRQFEAAHARSAFNRRVCAMLGRNNSLLCLHEALKQRGHGREEGADPGNSSYVGLRMVPLTEIRGSEGRTDDFDAQFRPLRDHDRDRWVSVLLAMRHGVVMPPVELIQVGDIYFVRDGHHRISAARQMGQREIEATVTRLA